MKKDDIFLLFTSNVTGTLKVCEFPVGSLTKSQIFQLGEEIKVYNSHIINLLKGRADVQFYNNPFEKEILFEIEEGRGYDYITEQAIYPEKYYEATLETPEFSLFEKRFAEYEKGELIEITQEIAYKIFVDKPFNNRFFSLGGLFPLEITERGIQMKFE